MSLPEGIHCRVSTTRKIDACCDPGSKRYVLGAVELVPNEHFDERNGVWAAATDGRCLTVSLEAGECEERKPYLLPCKLLKPGKKPAHAKLNGRWESGDKFADQPEGLFPRVHDVLPDCTGRLAITLDVNLLAKIAAAISNTGRVTLFIPPEAKNNSYRAAIGVVADDGIGCLMPVSDAENAHNQYESTRKAYSADRLAATTLAPVPLP